ncbi:hypothetical protein OH77DRAFT_319140 [Trametes cingulata]|nr:hypothetical protein OH77DRAFT_319140 [Trametes cingulata]
MPSTYGTPRPAPPSYNSIYPINEQTPLTGRSKSRTFGMLYGCIAMIALALFMAQNVGLVRCPLNDVPAAEKAELRRQWRLEQDAHRAQSDAWARERREHTSEVRLWAREREAHNAERDQWIKERDEEERAWRKRREVERREEERQRQKIRDAFRREREKEERERQDAREAFDREREVWRERREEEERHRLEVVRRSQGVWWTEPHGELHCHSYGTRTYSAYLKDIPGDLNWREVCDNMPPVSIHGREISKPHKCERNDNGEVVGVWYVDFDEPNCRPYWETVYDKGCTPGMSGFQRFEARLDGIGKGDDWDMMCATTPATIRGVHFDRPSTCENRGTWSGMVGIWDYPNTHCQ